VDAGPGGEGFRGYRDGPAVQGEDQLVGVADDAVQEKAQRGEAGLAEVLGVLRAPQDEAEGAQRQGFQQGLAVRVVPVKRADAHPGVRCDGSHWHLTALAQDRRYRRGEHAFLVGQRVTAHAAPTAALRHVVFYGHRPIMPSPRPPTSHGATADWCGRSRCRPARKGMSMWTKCSGCGTM